jgi:hypothetical protein
MQLVAKQHKRMLSNHPFGDAGGESFRLQTSSLGNGFHNSILIFTPSPKIIRCWEISTKPPREGARHRRYQPSKAPAIPRRLPDLVIFKLANPLYFKICLDYFGHIA